MTDDILTYTGRRFDLLRPSPGDIDIVDIAHALAHVCRWGGHCMHWYSVGQHSLWVSAYVEYERPDLALHALLHDAAEAYIGDIVTPLKRTMSVGVTGGGLVSIFRAEARIEAAIAEALELRPLTEQERAIVRRGDAVALSTECRDLRGRQPWPGLPPPHPDRIEPIREPDSVRDAFIAAYRRLRG